MKEEAAEKEKQENVRSNKEKENGKNGLRVTNSTLGGIVKAATELKNTRARAFYCLNLELTATIVINYQACSVSFELLHLIPRNL